MLLKTEGGMTMKRYSQKELRAMCAEKSAVDITLARDTELSAIKQKEGYCRQIGYAAGIYGCNGVLYKGETTGTLYAIHKRTFALYFSMY